MLFKKPDVLNFTIWAQISSREMKNSHVYCWGIENYKGCAIIQDFIAYWAIKNEEMVIVWKFCLESESSQPAKNERCSRVIWIENQLR